MNENKIFVRNAIILLVIAAVGLYIYFYYPFPTLTGNETVTYESGSSIVGEEKEMIISSFNKISRSTLSPMIGTPRKTIFIYAETGKRIVINENTNKVVTISISQGDKTTLKTTNVSSPRLAEILPAFPTNV
jgi:hypothetical protein